MSEEVTEQLVILDLKTIPFIFESEVQVAGILSAFECPEGHNHSNEKVFVFTFTDEKGFRRKWWTPVNGGLGQSLLNGDFTQECRDALDNADFGPYSGE